MDRLLLKEISLQRAAAGARPALTGGSSEPRLPPAATAALVAPIHRSKAWCGGDRSRLGRRRAA